MTLLTVSAAINDFFPIACRKPATFIPSDFADSSGLSLFVLIIQQIRREFSGFVLFFRICFLELRHEGAAHTGERRRVGKGQQILISPIIQLLRSFEGACHSTQEFAGAKNLLFDLCDLFLNFRMHGACKVAHRGGKVHGADEDSIHAVNLHDFVQIVDCLRRLERNIYEDLVICFLQIVGRVQSIADRTWAAGYAADTGHTVFGILAGTYSKLCLFARIDIRNVDARCAGIEGLLDRDKIVPGNTDIDVRSIVTAGLDL